MISLKDFNAKYTICPICNSCYLDNRETVKVTYIKCKKCWSSSFGFQFWFEKDHFSGLNIWNEYIQVYFRYKGISNNFNVQVVDRMKIFDANMGTINTFDLTCENLDDIFNKNYLINILNTISTFS